MASPEFLKRFYYRNWFLFYSIRRWEYGIAKRFARGRLLDAGCGNGALTLRFSRFASETIAIDSSAGVVAAAKKYNNPFGGINYSVGTLRKLDFPNGCFDSVVCISVLGQCDGYRDEVVRELLRVTRKGGVVVLAANAVFINGLKIMKVMKDENGNVRRGNREANGKEIEVQRFYALKSRVLRRAYDFFLKYRDWRTLFSFFMHPLFWLDARFGRGKGQTEIVVIQKN